MSNCILWKPAQGARSVDSALARRGPEALAVQPRVLCSRSVAPRCLAAARGGGVAREFRESRSRSRAQETRASVHAFSTSSISLPFSSVKNPPPRPVDPFTLSTGEGDRFLILCTITEDITTGTRLFFPLSLFLSLHFYLGQRIGSRSVHPTLVTCKLGNVVLVNRTSLYFIYLCFF